MMALAPSCLSWGGLLTTPGEGNPPHAYLSFRVLMSGSPLGCLGNEDDAGEWSNSVGRVHALIAARSEVSGRWQVGVHQPAANYWVDQFYTNGSMRFIACIP